MVVKSNRVEELQEQRDQIKKDSMQTVEAYKLDEALKQAGIESKEETEQEKEKITTEEIINEMKGK